MSLLLVIGGALLGVVWLVVRGMFASEMNGRMERRIEASVEEVIASMSSDLQDEWADEWRADLAKVIAMPWTAWRFVRGLRQSAAQLSSQSGLEPAMAPTWRTASRRGSSWRLPLRHSEAMVRRLIETLKKVDENMWIRLVSLIALIVLIVGGITAFSGIVETVGVTLGVVELVGLLLIEWRRLRS